jgi:protease-4
MRRILLAVVFLALFNLVGCGMPSLLVTPVQNTNRLDEIEVAQGHGWSQPKIAMIEVEGMLMNARTGGFLQPTENVVSLFTQQLQMAERDPDVKAVVLRVNSPGGTVTASDTMYQELIRFKAKTHKPVIASCQEICASGAYYVSCASDEIIANPTSIVGSIGVIFNTFDASQGLAKLGIYSSAVKSGQFKDMGSPFKPVTAPERELMQGMVDDYFARFKNVVTTNRKNLAAKNLPTATDGRVFSGEQALAIGLVDRIGLLEDAIDLAKQKANAPNAKVVMYKRPYGYNGSIYASTNAPTPQANVLHLDLPDAGLFLGKGFYYIWNP